ncbi:MAG: DNA polymerase III subunit delta [bacterium]
MIIFLYGEDTYRSRKKLKEFKEKFIRDVEGGGSSFDVINGESATMGELEKILGGTALFSRKKMVVIEKIFSNKNKDLTTKLSEYLKGKKNFEDIIIFWDNISGEKKEKNKLFSFLFKQNITQNFKLFSGTESANWAREEAMARGAKMTHQTALALTGLFGSDLWQLNNEIDKLISYKRGLNKGLNIAGQSQEVEITEADIDLLCRGKVSENIFALVDAISNKNKSLAIELFEKEIEAGAVDVYLLQMIIRQFRILLQVKTAQEDGHTSRKTALDLKLHPFVVQKSFSQAKNFALPLLKNIFKNLIEIDKNLKTGKIDARQALEILILKI